MSNQIQKKSLLIGFLLLFTTASAVSFANSGGGGGAPRSSAPNIDPVATYKKGLEYLQEEKYKKAARSFRKVLSVSKKDPNSNYLLGVSYVGMENMKKARKPLEKALKYDDSNVAARGLLGAVYHALEKPEKAAAQKQILLDLQQACNDCAEKKDIDSALQRLEMGAQKANESSFVPHGTDKANSETAYLKAVELINRGDYQLALTSLRQAARAMGPNPDLITYQGFANRKLGNMDQALAFYQVALDIQPEHRGANEYLGEYYVEIGDMAAAYQQLEKLNAICAFGCESAEELKRWIQQAEAQS